MQPFGLTHEELGWLFAAASFLLFAIIMIRLSGRPKARRSSHHGRNRRHQQPVMQEPQVRGTRDEEDGLP